MNDVELSPKLDRLFDDNTVDNDFIAHPDFVYDKLLELECEIKKLQAENAELKKLTVKALGEVGLELEEDTRIGKKVMPFVRAIVLSKIQEFK